MKFIETHNVSLSFASPQMARQAAKRVIYSLDKIASQDIEVVIGVVEMPNAIKFTPVFVLSKHSIGCKDAIASMGFAINSN